MTTSLDFIDHNGQPSSVHDCEMSIDASGRFYLWSEGLEQNLAHRARDRNSCLLEAIDSLLFLIKLRDERIAEMKVTCDIARKFADAINQE